MKKTLIAMAVVAFMLSLSMLSGCASKSMDDSMDHSTDTMSGEKMDKGMGSMQEDTMQDSTKGMQNNDMDKTMK